MKIFLQILQFFPYVLAGVVAVEAAVPTTTAGTTKKAIVLSSIEAAAKVGETVPSANVALISGIIDALVGQLNASGIFNHHTAASAVVPAVTAAA